MYLTKSQTMLMMSKVILSCLFILFNSTTQGQTALEILDRYIDTVSYGDVSRWEKIKTVYSTSVGYFSAEDFELSQMPGTDKISYKKTYKVLPDKVKEELYSDSLYVNLTGEFYYLKDRRTIFLANLPPMNLIADNSQWFDFYPMTLNRYVKNNRPMDYKGVKKLDGIESTLYEVDIETEEKEHRSFFFNTETFLLEAISFPENNVVWIFSKYKTIDGYLLPTLIVNMNNGKMFSYSIYKQIIFNQPIDMTKFKHR